MEKEILHILLADDDQDDRYIFKEAFTELKIKTIVDTVNDGVQLMERLHRKGIPLPHLLFLDLNMPRKNGLQCLKEIRKDERLKNILVAIYTTSGNEKDMDETFINGANIFITKPADFEELKQVLETAVTRASAYHEEPFNRKNFLLKI